MQNENGGPLLAEKISLPRGTRVYVIIHKASKVKKGNIFFDHLLRPIVPDWTMKTIDPDYKEPNVYVKLLKDVRPNHLLADVEPINVNFNNDVESQCIIRDGDNFYKAFLKPEDYEVMYNPNISVIYVRTPNTGKGNSIIRMVGELKRWPHHDIPSWVE